MLNEKLKDARITMGIEVRQGKPRTMPWLVQRTTVGYTLRSTHYGLLVSVFVVAMTKYLTETKEEGPDDCKRGPPMATLILVLGQNIMAEDGGGGRLLTTSPHGWST